MSDMLPIATYNLNVEPYSPIPAIDETRPVTIRLTMAALNPDSYDEDKTPSTLRVLKRNPEYDSDGDIIGDSDEDEEDSEEEEEEEEEEEDKNSKKSKKQGNQDKKNKQDSKGKKDESEPESESESEGDEVEDSEEDSEIEDDDEFEEYVLVTLSPETQYQQSLDLTIAPEEDVQFVVTGSYAVTVSGNYVKHPFDAPFLRDDDEEDEEDDEEDEEGHHHHHHHHHDGEEAEDSDEYDLTPDEDEVINDELDELEDASDVEGRIEELIDQEDQSKKNKKRKQEEAEQPQESEPKKTKKEKKEAGKKQQEPEEAPKKDTKKDKKEKKVEFKKDLEEGPTQKPKTKALEGGVVIEDRTVGKGAQAKKGSKVGMRYVGKLKNGKIFDKNTSGKPFVFKLGVGEVIKGWDIGVAGMAVGGERRVVIPSAYAYGKQALPGLPANSDLTFDVKLVSLK